jgi:hypothetical protein
VCWAWKLRWINQVTLRSLEMCWEHATSGYGDKIGPTPLLMIVEDADTLGAVDHALDAFNRAHEPKKLVFSTAATSTPTSATRKPPPRPPATDTCSTCRPEHHVARSHKYPLQALWSGPIPGATPQPRTRPTDHRRPAMPDLDAASPAVQSRVAAAGASVTTSLSVNDRPVTILTTPAPPCWTCCATSSG